MLWNLHLPGGSIHVFNVEYEKLNYKKQQIRYNLRKKKQKYSYAFLMYVQMIVYQVCPLSIFPQ